MKREPVEKVEREAARRAKAARAGYKASMALLYASFKDQQREIERTEREALKDAERWRVMSTAALTGRAPVRLSDIRSVKREVGEHGTRKAVSVAHVAFLERSAT